MIRRGPTAMLLAGILPLSAIGCGPYVLRGRVVEGNESAVQTVHADDPRLDQPGIPAASIELTLDPQTLGRRVLSERASEPDGSFAIPIDLFGAGVLEHEFGIVVRSRGYRSAQETFMLPPGDRRLLITLSRGRDRYVPPEDPLDQAEQFLRER